ncbi:unnamed protein product [Ixodes persulcatus]
MKLVLFTCAILFFTVISKADGEELKCPKRRRQSEDTSCNYFCRNAANNGWDEGHLEDGERCNYNGIDDGVCKDGLCYLRSDEASPPPTRDETSSEDEPAPPTKKPKKKQKKKH